jgi:hypothetical protein
MRHIPLWHRKEAYHSSQRVAKVPMAKQRVVCWTVLALAELICVRSFAADPIAAVQSCTSEDDDLRRLACYDKALNRHPSHPIIEQTFGLSAAAVVSREHLPEAPKEMTVQVVAIGQPLHAGLTLTLANQQMWVQQDYDGGYFPLHVGDTVSVTPGLLGSYLLTSARNGHRSIRVKRVR